MLKILFVIVIFLGLLGTILIQWFVIEDRKAIIGHQDAYTDFLRDSAIIACVTKLDMAQAGRDQGLSVDEDTSFHYGPDEWDDALHIDLSPPMPFAKLPGVVFYFDAQGCLMP